MINPFVDIATGTSANTPSQPAVGLRWRVFLVALALSVGLMFLAWPAAAQVQIVNADAGIPDYSAYYQALEAREAGDNNLAFRLFTEAAENGLAIAQYNLGVMYYSGSGGATQDYYKAYQWTRAAAEQGHVNAMLNLGSLYYNQLGVNPSWMDFWPMTRILQDSNFTEAANWYALAAEYDNGEAQLRLATLYEEGAGVDQDKVEALKWALLARDNEVEAAVDLVSSLQSGMNTEQINRAQQAYARWVLEYRG